MQFLYSAFSLPKLAQSALHIITPGRPVTSITCCYSNKPSFIVTLQTGFNCHTNLQRIHINIFFVRVFNEKEMLCPI